MASIHENIFTATMSMEITKNCQFSLLAKLSNQLFSMVNSRMKYFTRCFPPSVQVAASKGTSVVSVNNTVGIEHGNNFEDKVLS